MRLMRRAARYLTCGWLAGQLAAFAAAPVVLCPHQRALESPQHACCPGVGPGQVCPMHHTREGVPVCAMQSTCHQSDAAIVSLFATIGIAPAAGIAVDPPSGFDRAVLQRFVPTVRADLPDSPPPRA